MPAAELKSAKKMFIACLLVFAGLVYLNHGKDKPVVLKGVVTGIIEENETPKALAVDVDGERFVVKITPQYLMSHMAPHLVKNQEVEIKADRFKAVMQGVTCEFLELVKAGPVREDLSPQGDEPLPVDDLKATLGRKGM